MAGSYRAIWRHKLKWLSYFAAMLRRTAGLRNRWMLLRCMCRAVAERAGWRGRPREYRLTLEGAVFHLDAARRDIVAYAPIWIARDYEADARFVPRPGGTVVDVGAHVGFFTVRAARAVGAGGRVYSLEPDPATFGRLERNVRANGLSHVSVFQCAVSNYEGRLSFLSDAHSTESRASTKPADNRILVPCITLDAFVRQQGIDRIDCLKIDAELSELQILECAQERALPQSRAVIVEIHDYRWVPTVDATMARSGLTKVREHNGVHFYCRT